MNANIVTAMISAGVTLVVCLINNFVQVQKSREEFKAFHEKTLALMEMKIDNLQKAVEKHNHVIERVYELEKQTEVQEEKLRVANHRIDDLERGVG